MDSVQTLREFLGWCTVMNVVLLLLASLILMAAGGPVRRIHGRISGLSDDDLSRAYFQYLGQYKIAILVFNLVPYLALHMVG